MPVCGLIYLAQNVLVGVMHYIAITENVILKLSAFFFPFHN
jgi:hypothetical protein